MRLPKFMGLKPLFSLFIQKQRKIDAFNELVAVFAFP